ncbi:related to Y.lipolytica glyoxylate pathway regulator GPR1 [Fusarium oxysporum]|uniref:Related to Y.lipolytica glyoxylate pathway regulator GPR1 n=1 Tax=Fusarium oxysporum TaxID=5507 RepID=A0A2H3TV37_FUSOX|nr:related to Y.lipolytica glyoxylate pathway regulator GPR1 [Fusarium oxysporum]
MADHRQKLHEDSDMTLAQPTNVYDPRSHSDTEMASACTHPRANQASPTPLVVYGPRKFANPSPLGLCSFAATTFVLSCINMNVRGETIPNIAIPLAFAYGGLIQLLAGMWEMAVGNTFSATAFSSYGGFWIAYGFLLTPPWSVLDEDGPYEGVTGSVMGFFLTSWWIFTTVLLICTLKSTFVSFFLFFAVDMCFLLLACKSYADDLGNAAAQGALQQAAGFFGFLASFLAWYSALAGIQDNSNSFFKVPMFHFPWSHIGQQLRKGRAEHNMA